MFLFLVSAYLPIHFLRNVIGYLEITFIKSASELCAFDETMGTCPSQFNKSWNQTIAILKTNETEELAYELAQHIPDYRIIDFHDLTSHLTQSEEEWKRYDGVIDLIGCGTNIIDSLEWIPWLQRLIEFGHRKD